MQYVAIGHVCQDVMPAGTTLGGTVTYAAATAAALGWKAASVTRAQAGLDVSMLGDIDWLQLPSDHTTTFENIYSATGRTQILHAWAGPIRPDDVPAAWLRADVVHLAPVADEIDPALVDHIDGAMMGVTPQGWMRRWDEQGHVSPRDWQSAETTLRRAGAVVLSIDDVAGDWRLIERWAGLARALAVTQGCDGCTLFVDGEATRVPATAHEEIDPTGAGDIFAAAFFTQMRASGDALNAARFANCIASKSITRRGLAGVPTPEEVKDCLEPFTTKTRPPCGGRRHEG